MRRRRDSVVCRPIHRLRIEQAVGPLPEVQRGFARVTLSADAADDLLFGALPSEFDAFMANPQLRAFDENHRLWPRRRLHDVIVLRRPLD